jgi:hydroxymethylpyrimidine pyrophosphatase-like HAD family hydrolase
MPYQALATDYDGTLARQGRVEASTLCALRRLKASGLRLILVTGRIPEDLASVFPGAAVFDRVVAENGAVIGNPGDGTETILGAPPPDAFLRDLRARGVAPLDRGRVIVATSDRHGDAVEAAIRESAPGYRIILNKGAAMILPAGVDKASGLAKALKELGLSPRHAIAVGDAENDIAMLASAGFAVAVADALPALKARADLVLRRANGRGVAELAARILEARPSGLYRPA